MIDLDRFKEINDSFGHSVGDDLLCLVGPRLERALQPGDLLARMGGDEFAVLLPDADAARAREVAGNLGAALRDAFVLDGMPLHVDASIGIALCPDHGRDRSLLLARADTAMYVAKRGRQGFAIWAPDGTPATRDRLETLEQLRTALDTDQLEVHYQPKLDLRTCTVIGVEALVRWNHPERGLLYPDVFLPLAEQAGLMRRLALRVLERSLRDLQQWRAAGLELSVAVNLSVSNLQDVALPEQVEMLLDAFGVPAEALILEITEDVLMADAARSQQVMAGPAPARRPAVHRRLRDRLLVAVLPARAAVDELKLDRSFVSHLTSDERAAAIVRSTLQLSQDLGMTMVVEGVEDAATLAALRSWGCDFAQGYHIARPMPADELPRLAGRAAGPPGAGRGPPPLRVAARGAAGRITCRAPPPTSSGWPPAAGGDSRRSASATGCCAPAAGSPAGPTPSWSSATRRPTCRRRRRGRPAGTPPAACARGPRCRCPAPRRPTPPSPPPAGPGTTTTSCSPRRSTAGRRRRSPVDLAPTPDDAWLAGYRYRGTPLPPVAREVLVNADDPVFAAVRCDPEPAPLAAVARGVLVDGWLCVTAVTVDERYRRRGLGDGGHGRGSAPGPASGVGTPACCRSPAPTPPALALYERLGFTEHHRYHYRLGADPAAGRPG